MIKFSKDKVKLLHQLISEEPGGSIGIRLEATNEEVAETGLAVAAGTMDYKELLNWVMDHRV